MLSCQLAKDHFKAKYTKGISSTDLITAVKAQGIKNGDGGFGRAGVNWTGPLLAMVPVSHVERLVL